MLTAVAVAMAVAAYAPTANEVTVYNQGFALVKETRVLDLKEGLQDLAITDVASKIEPDSVGIQSLTNPKGFSVLEQNYQYDLISQNAILNKSLGKKIRFIRTVANQKEILEGTLISAPYTTATINGYEQQQYNGIVLKTDDGRIVLNPTGEMDVASVPEGLISVPTLNWMIDSSAAGSNTVELSYLTQGMSWEANYVLLFDGHSLGDLKGWVTMDNNCGHSYENVKLKLLAGDVARVQQQNRNGGFTGGMLFAAKSAAADNFSEQSISEYHLYTMQRPATIRDKEKKQLSLLEGHGINVTKKLTIDSLHDYGVYYPSQGEVGTGDLKPQIRLEFKNSKENDLGVPLPKGKVKVYQRDDSGSVQMIGEAQIDHTPKNELLSLMIGEAFDIRASRKRMSFQVLSPNESRESFEVSVRNRKETAETVYLLERHYGDWQVQATSEPFEKADANTMQYVLHLKPGEDRKVTYTIITRWF
jgi:hypothetical protein